MNDLPMSDAGPEHEGEAPVRVTFLPSGKQIETPLRTTLLEATRRAGLPLASSCDGDAICSRCKVEICAGAEQLMPVTPGEQRLLTRLRASPEVRIACEARVLGDVSITVGYW